MENEIQESGFRTKAWRICKKAWHIYCKIGLVIWPLVLIVLLMEVLLAVVIFTL